MLFLTSISIRPVFIQAGSSSENSSIDSADVARNPVTMYSGSPPSRTSSTQSSAANADVTRDDLNAAIEAGDWAVVGATGKLMRLCAKVLHVSALTTFTLKLLFWLIPSTRQIILCHPASREQGILPDSHLPSHQKAVVSTVPQNWIGWSKPVTGKVSC